MGAAIRKLQKRKKAKEKLAELMENPDHVLVIHYSCESFYNRLDGTSPKIASIAVKNLESGQVKSFSVHQVAERRRQLDDIDGKYDILEKEMLSEFYKYVQAHTGYLWLHWNMRDIHYGFEALEHRIKVLGGKPQVISESSRVDLNRLLLDLYGFDYIDHPRLTKLIELNNFSKKDILTGQEEAQAFANKEYMRLHFSTLKKVDMLSNIATRTDQGQLKTNSSWKEFLYCYPQIIGEWFKDNWLASIVLGLGSLLGIILALIQLFRD